MDQQTREALEAARHALVTLQGLTALDGFGAYYEAAEYCDPNGCFDSLVEASWKIDDSKTIALIDAALAREGK